MRTYSRRASRAFVLTSFCSLGIATAASPTPPNQGTPQTTAAAQAKGTPPAKPRVVPLNSGVSPHEFPADTSKITLEVKANGVRVYHMNGQGREALVAHVGKDGKIEYRCTDQAENAPQAARVQENVHEQ